MHPSLPQVRPERHRGADSRPADKAFDALTGTPYFARMFIGLLKPRSNRLGVDFAGTVEAVGSDVDILAITKPGPTPTWFSHFENAIFVTVDFTAVKRYRNPNERHEGF